MKLITKKHILKGLAVITLSFSALIANSQSDNPCGAPALAVNASCTFTVGTNAGATNTAGVPVPGCANYQGGDVWYTVTVPASGNITFDMNTGVITDGGLAIYSGTCGALTLVECDDDDSANGLMSMIALTGQTPGATLWVRVWEYGGDNNGTFSICARAVAGPGPPPTNVNCTVPDPICSGSPIVFTAQSNGTAASTVNPGNNYDCLFTSPNPSWYYLEISTGGNLAIDITAGSDIDFELWGPFPSYANAVANCNSYGVPIDCSYSTAATEQANATGVTAGQVYVLLVTNFANTVQTITLADAAGNTATTDCSIVPLSVELTEFNGTFNNEMSEVHLMWNTSSERDNSHFIVERSVDTQVWSGVGIKAGSGTTTSATTYQMIDSNPNNGESYYRLKQFDLDGKMTISDIIRVNRTIENSIHVYPNPTKDAFTINSNNEILNVRIVDIQGGIVYTQNDVSQKLVRIDLSNLREGMYYAQIETEKGTTIERISVIK